MDPEKWKHLVQRIDVRAPAESVYAAWATAEGLMGWFPMEAALMGGDGEELEPGASASAGDQFRFTWHTGHTEEGEFLEARLAERLRFTFGEGIQVAVDLEPIDEGSVMVTLTQTQDRTDEENLKILLGFKEGWAFYLTNLKSVLEGGLDLRNHSLDTEDRVNY
jgi:uncharacterized protein YndB with AHSA1/START domain